MSALTNLRMVTVKEAAQALGVSYDCIWRFVKRGKVRAFREGPRGHYRIVEAELVAALEQEMGAPPPAPATRRVARPATIPEVSSIEDLLPPDAERVFGSFGGRA